ncbi:hypothetical protein T08_2631 [Trichinella sp. T8]|nr:hypothetical protein T08_2631 [Trichinella sp. T8]
MPALISSTKLPKQSRLSHLDDGSPLAWPNTVSRRDQNTPMSVGTSQEDLPVHPSSKENGKHRGPPRTSPLAGTFSLCPIVGPLGNARIEAGFPASQPADSVPGRAVHSETYVPSFFTEPSKTMRCFIASGLC